MRKRLRPFALQVRGKTPKQFRKILSYLFAELYITLLTDSVKKNVVKIATPLPQLRTTFFIIFLFIAIYLMSRKIRRWSSTRKYTDIYPFSVLCTDFPVACMQTKFQISPKLPAPRGRLSGPSVEYCTLCCVWWAVYY